MVSNEFVLIRADSATRRGARVVVAKGDKDTLKDALDGLLAPGGGVEAHTHPIADIVNLQDALDAKAATSHGHIIANVTGLQTALDGKAASSHSHALADLPVASSGTSSTTQLVRADDSRLSNARTPSAHTHPASEISDSTAAGRSMLTAATAAAQTALLDAFASGTKGLTPASGGGTTNFLRADGSWTDPTASLPAGTRKTYATSFTLATDYFLDIRCRMTLSGAIRATLQGNANLVVTDDFKTRSRIELAGRG